MESESNLNSLLVLKTKLGANSNNPSNWLLTPEDRANKRKPQSQSKQLNLCQLQRPRFLTSQPQFKILAEFHLSKEKSQTSLSCRVSRSGLSLLNLVSPLAPTLNI